jgi:predicted nuclease of restriction endonuclease-like RecB superfamily
LAIATQTLAQDYIDTFQRYRGKTQGELDRHLAEKEGDSPDYRLLRGFVHLLKRHFATFETCSPLDPPLLRQRLFSLASPPPLTDGDRQRSALFPKPPPAYPPFPAPLNFADRTGLRRNSPPP